MTVLERFRICALYLNRGISPALPIDTPNAHINIDGYSLAIQDAGELGSIHPHPDYDWAGSDVTIIAQNVAYFLHRSNLRAVSEVFNSLFDSDDKSYRKSSSPHIYLPGCLPSNIEAALSHIYPTRPGIAVFNSPKQWQLIFDFAFTFKFDSLWIAASQHLGKDMDPMDKIRIGRRRGWAGVLRQGFEEFSRSSQRTPSPDSEDAKLIGYDGLQIIMETRIQDSLSLRSPVSHIDVPQNETASTAHEETDMVLQPILSPVETIFDVNRSDISSDSITMVDWSPLTSSTAAHRSVFITGLFHVTSPLSGLHEDSEERSGGGRSIIKKSTPRIVEVEDLTIVTALEQKPPPPSTPIHTTDDSAITPVVLSPAALATPAAARPLTENTTIGAFPKGSPAEESKILSAQKIDTSSSRENQNSARTGANLTAPSRSGSDSGDRRSSRGAHTRDRELRDRDANRASGF
ncbi:hypothetical protein FIBSPDRAFT_1042457 [Athelia psychrophila]|uniref:BTB domain-containing protein n=1 Tax=Athelia psychrophila TaxID=1759441 RepID=A0A166MPA1_9AGAM|nr:hypothetical protein FIBSPDRAFT_1042457 [Fibularhizoctonia sp. CBS 109695]